jgi:putative ABC transport system substrate-binding protein
MNPKPLLWLLTVILLVSFHHAEAQQPRNVPRIGYLTLGAPSPSANQEAFRDGLRQLGYLEGQNIQVEYRYGGGKLEHLRELAAELVSLKVDVIVAANTQSIDAARQATRTIPIVFAVTFDPVESGFVASLARPGGNLTGLSTVNPDAAAKRVELFKEVIPRLSRLAVLRNPTNSGSEFPLIQTEEGAKQFGMHLQLLEARSAEDLDEIFRRASSQRAEALIVIVDALFIAEQRRISDLGIKYRLPEMFDTRQYVEAGGLISYGANLADLYRRAASYVDKILKGTNPADLPVEQPTKFELVINLKTAKQIGLTIPPNVLARADKVIR